MLDVLSENLKDHTNETARHIRKLIIVLRLTSVVPDIAIDKTAHHAAQRRIKIAINTIIFF